MGSGAVTSRGISSSPGVSRGFSHAPTSATSRRAFSRPPSANRGFRDHGSRFHSHGFGNFGFRNNCRGRGCWGFYGYPWLWGGYYDPWWWWDSGSSGNNDYESDAAVANEMNQQSLEEQRMRQQEAADGDQDAYSQGAAGQVPWRPSEPESDAPQPATVLVFRDQHRIEVENYAIVGQTLWNFAAHRTQKIPLADLDLSATVRANDDRGVTFRVPSAGEAQ